MKVNIANLVISAVSPKQYPSDQLPEIALAGRSNVGKSSFINTLIERKALARTSGQPGKTQTLNFYNINDLFRFVDVPGYGYARVSKTERHKWSNMINEYLSTRENLTTLFLLMDFRHSPTELDLQMKDLADDLEIPYAIVLTKVDKIKRSQRNKHIHMFEKALDIDENSFFLFSSETGLGKDEIWEVIDSQLNNYSEAD